jgi:hypothetical protein
VEVLRILRARLAAGGALLLTVPAAPRLWSWFDEASCHRRRYTHESLTASLAAAGFRVEFSTPFMAALYPIMWMSRRRRPPESSRAITDQVRIVPGVNGVMKSLLALELPLIRARCRLQTGTSLVAIARPA